jgi:hypothetical protein
VIRLVYVAVGISHDTVISVIELRLLTVVTVEAVLIGGYGTVFDMRSSGYTPETGVFWAIPVGAVAMSWWIILKGNRVGQWGALALSVPFACVGFLVGAIVALNTWAR